jgi:hypothetical protein
MIDEPFKICLSARARRPCRSSGANSQEPDNGVDSPRRLRVFPGACPTLVGQPRTVATCEIEEEVGKDTSVIVTGPEAGEVVEFHWRYSAALDDNQLRTLLVEGEKGWQPSAYGFDPQGPSVSVRHEVERQEFGDRLIYSIFERAEVLSHDRIMIETWRAWGDEERVRDREVQPPLA